MTRTLKNNDVTVKFSQAKTGSEVTIKLYQNGVCTGGLVCTPEVANTWYSTYRNRGFKTSAEVKAAAPKQTREEGLTKKYGDKESRKAYVEAKKAFHRYFMIKTPEKGFKDHKEYLKAIDQKVAYALQKWEEAGRPAYNC